MAESEPTLFDLQASDRTSRGRPVGAGKAGGRYRRTVAARVEVEDSAQLRDSALRLYDDGTVVVLGIEGDDEGVDTRDEIASNDAVALSWLIEPLDGLWDLLEQEAFELIGSSSDVDESTPGSLKVTCDVTIRLLNPGALLEQALANCGTDPDLRRDATTSLAAAWNVLGPAESALGKASGISTTIESVEVERV